MTLSTKVKKTVSITALRDFLDCRRQGRFREFWGVYEFQEALAFGIAIHEALEAFYRAWPNSSAGLVAGQSAITSYFQKTVIPELGHLADGSMAQVNHTYHLAWEVFLNYVEFDKAFPLIPPGSKIRHIEKLSSVDVKASAKLSGKLDLSYLDPDGNLVIVDHKTSSKGLDQSALDLDEQLTGYCYLEWRESGIIPDRVVYNTILKAVPEPPTVLKDGSLSVAKTQATTSSLFRQRMVEMNIPMSPKYDDYLAYLDNVGWSRFVSRDESRRTEIELQHFGMYVPYKVDDVATALSGPWDKAYPAPSIYRCGYCKYAGPCKSMMDGGDWEAIMDGKYRRF